MSYTTLRHPSAIVLIPVMLALLFAISCGGTAAEPRIVEKEVVVQKEVPVKKAVPVEKMVVMERVVVKEVPVQPTPAPRVNPGTLTVMVPDFASERFDRLWATGESANAYLTNMHASLVESDAERNMVPGIATEWSISPDGAAYSYKIRKGVKFHDGSELTAEDALWTFQHLYGSQALEYAIGSGFLKAARLVDQISLTQPDELTISFTEPYLEFHPGSSNAGGTPDPIMPRRAALNDIKVSEEYDRHPVGAGMMKLVKHTPRSLMRFERFEDYYYQPDNGLPKDRRVNFQTLDLVLVSEMSTRVAALRAGQADIVPISMSAMAQVAAGGGRLEFIPEAVAFDNPWIHCWKTNSNHPCRSKPVRQALNYAINRELMQDKLYGGPDLFVIGGLGFITPTVMGYTPGLDPFRYDPEKARQLLADAGYPGGQGFPTTIKLDVAPSGVLPFMVEAAQFVADSWKEELRIPSEVVVHDYTAMKKKRRTDELDGHIYFSRKGINLDPTSNVFRFYGSTEEDKRRGHDLKILQEVNKATQLTDRAAREKAFQEALPLIRDEALTLNLGYVNTPWGVGRRVEAWTPWPLTNYVSALWTVTIK